MTDNDKCLICGVNIFPNGSYYGLLPHNKQVKLIVNNNDKLTTLNNIPFTVTKKLWYDNPYKCYGPIIHKSCSELLQKKLGLELTFDSVSNHILRNTNLLQNTDYSEIKCKPGNDPCIKNDKKILKIWYSFMKYKIRIMQRKKCVSNMRQVRGLRYQAITRKGSCDLGELRRRTQKSVSSSSRSTRSLSEIKK